jgi:hypothetical protein
MLGAGFTRETSERVEGGEPLIPRDDRATPSLLQMCEKAQHEFWREIVDCEIIDCCFLCGSSKRKKQAKSIAVAL